MTIAYFCNDCRQYFVGSNFNQANLVATGLIIELQLNLSDKQLHICPKCVKKRASEILLNEREIECELKDTIWKDAGAMRGEE